MVLVGWQVMFGPDIAIAASRLNNESSPRGPSYTRSCGAVDITRAKVEGGGQPVYDLLSARRAPPRRESDELSNRATTPSPLR